MAKYLMQFRYYGNSSDGKNYPSSITKNSIKVFIIDDENNKYKFVIYFFIFIIFYSYYM